MEKLLKKKKEKEKELEITFLSERRSERLEKNLEKNKRGLIGNGEERKERQRSA